MLIAFNDISMSDLIQFIEKLNLPTYCATFPTRVTFL